MSSLKLDGWVWVGPDPETTRLNNPFQVDTLIKSRVEYQEIFKEPVCPCRVHPCRRKTTGNIIIFSTLCNTDSDGCRLGKVVVLGQQNYGNLYRYVFNPNLAVSRLNHLRVLHHNHTTKKTTNSEGYQQTHCPETSTVQDTRNSCAGSWLALCRAQKQNQEHQKGAGERRRAPAGSQ